MTVSLRMIQNNKIVKMESYEKLSFAFKEMLSRTKIMRVRLKTLSEINEIEQLEYNGIRSSLEYLKPEIKRTIIMLKICFYRQKNEDCNFIVKPTSINSIVKIKEPKQKSSVWEHQSESDKDDIHTRPTKIENAQRIVSYVNKEDNLIATMGLQKSTPATNFLNLTRRELLVKFEKYLTMFSKFTDNRIIIRIGIG